MGELKENGGQPFTIGQSEDFGRSLSARNWHHGKRYPGSAGWAVFWPPRGTLVCGHDELLE